MNLDVNEGGGRTAAALFASCGGRMTMMSEVARRLVNSESAKEVFATFCEIPAVAELLRTCEKVNGVVDTEGVVRHFSSVNHFEKIEREGTSIASELPKEVRAFAHTLLPVTIVGGKYLVEHGDSITELKGLVPIGKPDGVPYAHLAALIWLPDDLIWTDVSDEQTRNQIGAAGANIEIIDYDNAPLLQSETSRFVNELGL